MIPNWWVLIRDTVGNVKYQFVGARQEFGTMTQIIFSDYVNLVGSHALTFKGDLDWTEDVGLDYFVQIRNRPIGVQDWRDVYWGFHRTWVWRSDSVGNQSFTSYGYHVKHLLSRRIISDYVGSAGALKSGPAETVAKAYVDEACGPSADAARRFSGFSIQGNAGSGDQWDGDRAKRNLLEVVREISDVAGGDFNVVVTGTNPMTFEFRWYYPQLGEDHTQSSANPVVFSLDANNMMIPVSSINRSGEFNVVYMLGQDQGVAREVEIVLDPQARYNDSPWNRREVVRTDTNQTGQGLIDSGLLWIDHGGSPQEKMSFRIKQTPDLVWGVHFDVGDTITGIYRQTIDKRLAGIRMNASPAGEDLAVSMSDVV